MVRYRIKLNETLKTVVFVNKVFDIPICIVDEYEKFFNTKDSIYFAVRAEFESSATCPHTLFEVVGETNVVKNGSGTISLVIKDVTMNYENKRIVFILSAIKNDYNPINIEELVLPPIQCIRHELVIFEENKGPSYVWYKDEGGKDKCIVLTIRIHDSDGNAVRNRKVPLKATLMYHNGGPVPLQNILALSPDSRLFVDNFDGVIKLRINEVSTRHQGQMFQVAVSPDISQAPSAADISSTMCVPIDVKSKRNNHRDKEKANAGLRGIDNPAKRMRSQESNIAAAAAVGSLFGQAQALGLMAPSGSVLPSLTSAPLPSTVGTLNPVPILTNPTSDTLQSLKSQNGMGSASASMGLSFSNPDNVGAAVDNLVLWANTVMKGISDIQWKQVGYARTDDGNYDISKPLHSISNPQPFITTVSTEFASYVKGSLQYLAAVADKQQNGQEDLKDGEPWNDSNLENGGNTPLSIPVLGRDSSLNFLSSRFFGDSDQSNIVAPSLSRDVSFGATGLGIIEAPKLARNNSLFLADLSKSPGSLPFGDGIGLPDADSSANFIYATPIQVSSGFKGLPAFDRNMSLIGFYQEGDDNGFTPIESLTLLPEDIERANSILEDAIKKNDSAVKMLSRSENKLEKMRDDAIIYYLMNHHNLTSEK